MDYMSADIPSLTTNQSEKLKNFRESVADVLKPEHDDYFLLRWLRARSWDSTKAEQMLRASIEWRKQHGVDTELKTWTPPEVLAKYYPCGYPGNDKEGHPIWLEALGNMDVKGIMHSAKKTDIFRYKMQACEMMMDACDQQTTKLGRKIGRIVCIYDFQNFGLRHLWKPGFDLVARVFGMIEANYPEFLKACFIINGNWADKVFEVIDRDQMPKYWGGTMTGEDGDPICSHKVVIGGEVPKSYYLKDSVEVDPASLTSVVVGRGSSSQIELQVSEPNSVIRWYFTSEPYDVGFGIFRKTSEKAQSATDMEVIANTERANSHMVPEDGTVRVKNVGTYVARFDNTYSWVNAKKVYYSLEVLTPSEELSSNTDWVDGASTENLAQ